MKPYKLNIESLSIDEKIGQLLMIGIHGEVVSDEIINLIKTYKIGNVILFTRNIKTNEQVFNLTQSLQKLALKYLNIPMLISIDQEGGMVTRIKNEDLFYPGAMTLAANNSVDDTYQTGLEMGKMLNILGINMNLAPVLDVNHNPNNPVIGVRSYSDNPDEVSKYGIAFMKGLEQNVLATGKHFPGHGNTYVDSHLGLPKVESTLESLKAMDLIPFQAAINEKISALMTAHIHFPNIEPNGLPATLSKHILTDILRHELKYNGLIVTDGMQMDAISKIYGTVKGCEMSILAGADMALICHSYELQIETINHFKKLYEESILTLDILNDRVSRILDYKERIFNSIHLDKKFDDIIKTLNIKKQALKNYQIVENAATLVKGHAYVPNNHTLLITMKPEQTTIADEQQDKYDISDLIKEEVPELDITNVSIKPNKRDINALVSRSNSYQDVILMTYNANVYQEQIKLIDALAQSKVNLYVISMRNPYDLYYTKNIENYVCLYEYSPYAIKVLIKYLKGQLSLKGRVPIKYE